MIGGTVAEIATHKLNMSDREGDYFTLPIPDSSMAQIVDSNPSPQNEVLDKTLDGLEKLCP